MIITKKHLSRRTVLRGAGATLALPLLDAMVPALSAFSKTAAAPPRRLGIVYVPNGIVMDAWTPATDGADFEFSPALSPLEPFRDRVLVLTGLDLQPAVSQGEPLGVHARPASAFLTGLHAGMGSELNLGTSMDQFAARTLGRETQLASMELSLEPAEFQSCEPGYSCAYLNISWRDESTPMPTESNPRAVFERLFGEVSGLDNASRQARLRSDKSLLDSVRGKVSRLQQALGAHDQAKMDQYLTSIRDVERRIQKAEQQGAVELAGIDKPEGTPSDYGEHAELLFDMQLLAYQSDVTRVTSFMLGREQSGLSYPQIGVSEAHHPASHHAGNLDLIEKCAKINAYHLSLFAKYVEKLAATPDGEGSLLDNVAVLYGASMSDGNKHDPHNLPIVIAGGCGGELKGGRHLRYSPDTPLMNLHLTLLDMVGASVEKIGDSTGRLNGLSL